MPRDDEFAPLEAQRMIDDLVTYLKLHDRPPATWAIWVLYLVECMQNCLVESSAPMLLADVQRLIAARRESEM